MRKTSLILLSTIIVLAGAWALYAAGTASERESLQGVTPFRVAVGKLNADVVKDGLDATRLHAVMEDRLKAQGIPFDKNGANDLQLTVSTSPARDGYYAVHLRVEVCQLVALFHEYVRDPESRMMTGTWSATWTGILKKDELKTLDAELVKLVDQFIADWRIANLGRYK